eukprot:364347-Chlamydomonas_euryale.AAC.14
MLGACFRKASQAPCGSAPMGAASQGSKSLDLSREGRGAEFWLRLAERVLTAQHAWFDKHGCDPAQYAWYMRQQGGDKESGTKMLAAQVAVVFVASGCGRVCCGFHAPLPIYPPFYLCPITFPQLARAAVGARVGPPIPAGLAPQHHMRVVTSHPPLSTCAQKLRDSCIAEHGECAGARGGEGGSGSGSERGSESGSKGGGGGGNVRACALVARGGRMASCPLFMFWVIEGCRPKQTYMLPRPGSWIVRPTLGDVDGPSNAGCCRWPKQRWVLSMAQATLATLGAVDGPSNAGCG